MRCDRCLLNHSGPCGGGQPAQGGFIKTDSGKPKLSRLPRQSIEDIARVLDFGAQKYDWDNWRKCDDLRRYYDAALRHIYAALDEYEDPESGLPHLAHAACCIIFLLELDSRR